MSLVPKYGAAGDAAVLAEFPDPTSQSHLDSMSLMLREMRAQLPPGTRIGRPRDAATVMVIRRAGKAVEVLVGRRHSRHNFMPDMFVFPGGRVNRTDARVFRDLSLSRDVLELMSPHRSAARARSIGLAALRETFEETGIAVGRPLAGSRPDAGVEDWRTFGEAGFLPALDALHLIARAITPPVQQKRFDTWFFAVDAEAVPAAAEAIEAASGELEDIQWINCDEAARFGVASVTLAALVLLKRRLEAGRLCPASHIPVIRYLHGRYRIEPMRTDIGG